MEEYISNWKKLDLRFKGILSGFLGSRKQIEIVQDFIRDFRTDDTKVIIDPVMGDNGKPYPTYTDDMCMAMKDLVKYADILTPNLTEACILTDTPYTPETFVKKDYEALLMKIAEYGAKKIVITGIDSGIFLTNYIYDTGKGIYTTRQKRVGHVRSGTGDVFSAIIAADAVHDIDFRESVKRASSFVKKCIEVTETFDIPPTDGVCFEEVLHTLKCN